MRMLMGVHHPCTIRLPYSLPPSVILCGGNTGRALPAPTDAVSRTVQVCWTD